MIPVYLNNFQCLEDVEREFDCIIPDKAELLLAWYGDGSYSGSAYVLYKENGKLFHVFGGHCSCDGLEGQWEPEETSIPHLKTLKLDDDYYEGTPGAQVALEKIVKELENE